jgi:hypothetical protein
MVMIQESTVPNPDRLPLPEHLCNEKRLIVVLFSQTRLGKYEAMLVHLETDHNYKPIYSCLRCAEEFPTQSKLNK